MRDFDAIAPGQTCRACNLPYEGNHEVTPLGAVRCNQRGSNAGLVPWREHQLHTRAGDPYFSIMEQAGVVAMLLEGDGLPRGSQAVRRHLRELLARVEARTPAPPHRIGPADMPRLLRAPFPDVPLGLYAHYKEARYVCLGGGLRATGLDEEVLIAYAPHYPRHGQYYQAHRTREDWLEPVEVGGETRPRFQLVEPWSVRRTYDYLGTMLYMALSPAPAAVDPETSAREDPGA